MTAELVNRVKFGFLLALVLVLVLLAGKVALIFSAVALGATAVYELLISTKELKSKEATLFVGIFVCYFLLISFFLDSATKLILFSSLLSILVICFGLFLVERVNYSFTLSKFSLSLAYSLLISVVFFTSLIQLINNNYQTSFILWMFSITAATDVFAFFGGKFFKGSTIAPRISKNKTISGAISGLLMGATFGAVSSYYLFDKNYSLFLIFSLLISVFSQFGDLFFSFIKRSLEIKDFSNLIPGHGGVLDRIDSALFVSPVVLLVSYLYSIL